MSALILHHYGYSPFSEKIRLLFGLKRLAWQSVIIPAIMPKPDLLPLTGGYRHTPVLQIGADIYCDTRLIVAEIERRHPSPALDPPGRRGLATAIEAWAERDLFWPLARYVSGVNAATVETGLLADRAALHGKPAPTPDRLRALAQRSRGQIQVEIPRVEDMLGDGRAYLLGPTPGLADLAVYHGLWFLSAFAIDCRAELDGFPAVRGWMARVAGIGHGRRLELDAKAALARAAATEALPPRPSIADAALPPLGARAAVRPENYNTPAVTGALVLIDRNEIALRRYDAAVGEVVVHFPRLGYAIKPI